MAPKGTVHAPSTGDLEQELQSIQPQLYTLFAAQTDARDDLHNAKAAQDSASGADLTEAVLAVEKFQAEVISITKKIAPLKERAESLRKEIDAHKRADYIARVQQHAKAASALAPQVAGSLDTLLEQLAAFIGQLNAIGDKDVKAEIRALARYVEVRLHAAGLPDYKREGVQFHTGGTSPVDVAEVAKVFAETQQ
jgi:predicted  nucleic acid-binding Zn-ribbon protein